MRVDDAYESVIWLHAVAGAGIRAVWSLVPVAQAYRLILEIFGKACVEARTGGTLFREYDRSPVAAPEVELRNSVTECHLACPMKGWPASGF